MHTEPVILLTIVAEAVVEHRLVRDLATSGARGWTICDARGQGSRGVRADEFEGANIRVEALVAPEAADRVMELLARDYFPHYAVVAWTTPAQVVRSQKYV